MHDKPRPDDAALLNEIARLTAALIRVVRRSDDPQLKAEIAELIWPPHPPQPSARRYPMPTVLSARARKLQIALLQAVLIVVAAVNLGPSGDVGSALITAIPAAILAVAVYFVGNDVTIPSAKFWTSIAGALGSFVVYLIQHGTDSYRSAAGVLGAAVITSLILWNTENAPAEPA